jgi:hypothetical protein
MARKESTLSIKRPHYFRYQFLGEQDFKDEQAYHVEMRRRLNKMLHGWGVVDGLEVKKSNDREIVIEPGMAIDKDGREVVLTEPVIRDLSHFEQNSHTYATIVYAETWEEADYQLLGGVEGYTRITERPEIHERRHEPPQDGTVITLARVHLNDIGHISSINMDAAIRRRCGFVSAAAGWMRLPFKPTRVNPVKIDRRRVRVVSQDEEAEFEFVVDEATAYCDEQGARGSMQIPVPPSARQIVGFRIAGTTRGKVTVHLFRAGWNLHENRGEKKELLNEMVQGPTFHKEFTVDSKLDESHALAVSVWAEGETEIFLVAAKFQ